MPQLVLIFLRQDALVGFGEWERGSELGQGTGMFKVGLSKS